MAQSGQSLSGHPDPEINGGEGLQLVAPAAEMCIEMGVSPSLDELPSSPKPCLPPALLLLTPPGSKGDPGTWRWSGINKSLGERALETPQREHGVGLPAGEGAEQTAIFHRTQTAGTVLNGTCRSHSCRLGAFTQLFSPLLFFFLLFVF